MFPLRDLYRLNCSNSPGIAGCDAVIRTRSAALEGVAPIHHSFTRDTEMP